MYKNSIFNDPQNNNRTNDEPLKKLVCELRLLTLPHEEPVKYTLRSAL